MIFRKDRSTRGGGILLAIKENLCPRLVETCELHEIILVNVTFNNETHTLILVYRPPSTNSNENNSFINYLNQKIEDKKNVYIFGDFNYPHINWANCSSSVTMETDFLNFCTGNALSQFVTEPTRENNILDLFLSFDNLEPMETKVINNFSTSDHAIVEVYLNNCHHINSPAKIVKDFNNANWELIHSHLACINWDSFFYDTNVHHMWLQLKNLLLFLIDTYVPSKRLKPHKSAPWFNNFLRSLSRKKNHYINATEEPER